MPDRTFPPPDHRTPTTAATTLIACGHVLGAGARQLPLPPLPCYQALGPWGEPDAGLPWFRIGQAEGTPVAGEPASLRQSPAAPLADILRGRGGLLLVVGGDHDSLSLAQAIATYARGRGIRVMALLAGRAGAPVALEHCTDVISVCPAGQDPLLAAFALWSGVAGPEPHDGAPASGRR